MKASVIYDTNIDYEASYEKLLDSNLVVTDITQKGLLSIRFKGSKTIFLISHKGKLQVFWGSREEKVTLFDTLMNLLVGEYGEEVWIKPLQQTATIPYGKEFVLYWCKKGIRYTQKKVSPWTIVASALLLFLFLVYYTANLDYSLVFLNQTILNPLREVTTPYTILLLALWPLLLLFRDWLNSRNITAKL